MKKLALVGYGKMGKLIGQLAPEYGFELYSTVDLNEDIRKVQGADVTIEFTTPHAALANIEALVAMDMPTVVGTTGWLDHLDRVKEMVARHETGLVWGSNFSIGVNVFLKVVREAAQLLANESQYEAWAWEIHHSAKKDAPSGTLLTLVEKMRQAGYQRNIDIGSNRAGAHPGTHEIGFDSAADTITLRHTARSREGFARGALRAAQWIQGKRGVYEFQDIVIG